MTFGSAAGLLLGLLASRVLAFIVYQATPRDPVVLTGVVLAMALFFLSGRRRHTRCSRDWSSDVCSADLARLTPGHDARCEMPDVEPADEEARCTRPSVQPSSSRVEWSPGTFHRTVVTTGREAIG